MPLSVNRFYIFQLPPAQRFTAIVLTMLQMLMFYTLSCNRKQHFKKGGKTTRDL